MRRTLLALAAVLLGLAVIALVGPRRGAPAEAPGEPAALRPALAPAPGPAAAAPSVVPARAAPPFEDTPPPLTAYPVDLEQLRVLLPDNLYWETGVPTSDPAVARRRADRARRLNDLYGKVLSGTGTEGEIRTYFEERRREHEDAIAFARTALETGGARLPERDRSLLQLAVELHAARLDEAPARMAEAFARREEQERRREAWRAAGSPVP